eukprot:COSAG06_NODE_4875_length_3888_cov_11.473740_5_plen_112_part_00
MALRVVEGRHDRLKKRIATADSTAPAVSPACHGSNDKMQSVSSVRRSNATVAATARQMARRNVKRSSRLRVCVCVDIPARPPLRACSVTAAAYHGKQSQPIAITISNDYPS